MELYKRKALVLAKIETAYGTDATPLGANAINVSDLKIEPAKGDKLARNLIQPDLSTQAGVITKKHQLVTFNVELKGSGAADTAPACGPLLRSCMLSETITAATKVEYQPVSASFESCTIYVNLDGVLHKLVGCRGNGTLTFPAGGYPTIAFSFLALYAAPADVGAATPTYQNVVPKEVNAANTAFDLDGYTANLHKLTCDFGVKTKYRELPNAAASIVFTGGGRESKGNVTMDAVKMATKNYFTTWANSTLVALSLMHGGATAGHKVTLVAPKVQLDNIQYADDDGILTYDLPVTYSKDAGDDEFVLTFS